MADDRPFVPLPNLFQPRPDDSMRLRREALMAALGDIPGMVEPGNVDLYRQPVVPNPDGTSSTVDSSSYGIGGLETLLPSVTPDGRHLLSPIDILREYMRSGRHLGRFKTPTDATAYASQLHRDYEAGKYRR